MTWANNDRFSSDSEIEEDEDVSKAHSIRNICTTFNSKQKENYVCVSKGCSACQEVEGEANDNEDTMINHIITNQIKLRTRRNSKNSCKM